jgi:hypothetical protein
LDAGNITRKNVPLMTDKTRIPMFWWTDFTSDSQPGKDLSSLPKLSPLEPRAQTGQPALKDNYREIDEYNTAWQNLAVTHSKIGNVEIAPKGVSAEDHALKQRQDVLKTSGEEWKAGQVFDTTGQTRLSVLALLGWTAACYAIIWIGLIYAEPETLRPKWARRVRVQ